MTHDPLAGCRVLGFDLETTGLNRKSHRIIQYALVGCDNDGSEINIEELVNPERKIPSAATQVHGFYDADVSKAPIFAEVIPTFSKYVEGAVIVGHNVRNFDWPFIENEYLRAGELAPVPLAIIDTLQLARRLRIPSPRTLAALCIRYDIELHNAHTAGADSAATLLLLWRMMADNPAPFRRPLKDIESWIAHDGQDAEESLLGPGYDDLEKVDRAGRLRVSGEGDIILAFGRHRGKTVGEVCDIDASYINWLLSSRSPVDSVAREQLRKMLASN
jgi:DNA polymerase-3 subunit epsilon